MITLERNEKTGIVEAYRDGKKIDNITTIGDKIKKDDKQFIKKK